MSLVEKLMGTKLGEEVEPTCKISIVGVGEIGSAIAYTIVLKGLCNELALFDTNENHLNGELLDLKQGLAYQTNMKLVGSTNPSITENSKIIIMAAGVRPEPGQRPTACIEKNFEIFKDLIPQLAKLSPNALFLIVTNPVDTMTYATWKLSGFPFERVMGMGTNIESQRFRYQLSEKLGIAANSISAWVIGEHGETAVPVWSSVNIAGVNLIDLHKQLGKEDDPEHWNECYKEVFQSLHNILKIKGHTNWAPAIAVTKIVEAIVHNERSVYCVSTCAKNWHQSDKFGIKEDVFMSLPCVIGKNGVMAIINQALNDDEIQNLRKSSEKLYNSQKEINI